MPTQVFDVGSTPLDILTANDLDGNPLVLEIGKTYIGRYEAVDPAAVLRVLEAPDGTNPDSSAIGLPVLPYEDLTIIPATGLAIYIWERSGAGVLIVNPVR